MQKRLLALLVVFVLGTAIAYAVSVAHGAAGEDASSEVVGPADKSAHLAGQDDTARQADAESNFDLASLRHAGAHKVKAASLMQAKSWYTPPPPPPPAPVSVLPPPPPSAPAMPFTYIGRLVDRGTVTLFLSKNDVQYVVREHDVLENTYRVEKIGERDAVLTYIPLDMQQTLQFGSTAEESFPLGARETQIPQPANSTPPTK